MMIIDFHTHGKLAKKLPFSKEYTHWLFSEAKEAGLDALCLTEHFNTSGFEEVYQYIYENSVPDGDSLLFDGLRIFPGMETDVEEGGHILCIGPMEAILSLNRELEPYKEKGKFLKFEELMNLFERYPVIVGGAHPFREGSHIPEFPREQLERFHFFDLNGKDVAEQEEKTKSLTFQFGKDLNRKIVGGSDTHQAVQYGCMSNLFKKECRTVEELYQEMIADQYEIVISPNGSHMVKSAGILKKALKEIHFLGGDYVSLLKGVVTHDF